MNSHIFRLTSMIRETMRTNNNILVTSTTRMTELLYIVEWWQLYRLLSSPTLSPQHTFNFIIYHHHLSSPSLEVEIECVKINHTSQVFYKITLKEMRKTCELVGSLLSLIAVLQSMKLFYHRHPQGRPWTWPCSQYIVAANNSSMTITKYRKAFQNLLPFLYIFFLRILNRANSFYDQVQWFLQIFGYSLYLVSNPNNSVLFPYVSSSWRFYFGSTCAAINDRVVITKKTYIGWEQTWMDMVYFRRHLLRVNHCY